MEKPTKIVWSNQFLDFEDWREDLETYYPEASENELMKLMYEINDEYLGDERENLNIKLNRPIIVIASLGLWNGTRNGYKEIFSGNIRDCLYTDTDYATWYVDEEGDLRCQAVHHDGRNSYLYRVYKADATDEQIDALKMKICYETATQEDIASVTESVGLAVCKVYGWR